VTFVSLSTPIVNRKGARNQRLRKKINTSASLRLRLVWRLFTVQNSTDLPLVV